MTAFCARQSKTLASVRFLFEGQRVQPTDTPDNPETRVSIVASPNALPLRPSCSWQASSTGLISKNTTARHGGQLGLQVPVQQAALFVVRPTHSRYTIAASSNNRFGLECCETFVLVMKALADLASVSCEMDPDLRLTSRPANLKREIERLFVDIVGTCTRLVRNNTAMRNAMDFRAGLSLLCFLLFSRQATITAHIFHIRPPKTPFDLCRQAPASYPSGSVQESKQEAPITGFGTVPSALIVPT